MLLEITPLLSTYLKFSNQKSSLNIFKFTDLITQCSNTVSDTIKNKELHLIPYKNPGISDALLPPREIAYLKIFLHVLG